MPACGRSQALTDVIFEPLAARQVLNSRQADIQAAKNDSLFRTAEAYFSVHQYRGMYAGALYAVERGHDLVDRIARLSKDLVPRVEVDRARNMLADLEQQATSARETWRVHSANLTQVLRLDPRAVVVPLEHDHLQITLIDPARPLDDLIPVGLTNRPELASHQALVQAVAARIRREKGRMLLPSILINGFQTPDELIQAGIFGMGPNNKLNQWTGRDDVSFQVMWELDAFGIGNLARIKEQRGEQSRAIIELFKTQDMVAADVTRAQARLQSAAARVGQADRALRSSLIAFNGNYEGLQQTTRFGDVLVAGLPAAGSGLRTPAFEDGLGRVLHHGRRIQPGAVRGVPRAGLPRPRNRIASSPPATSSRWTRRGPPTCRRWAMVRPPQPAKGLLILIPILILILILFRFVQDSR